MKQVLWVLQCMLTFLFSQAGGVRFRAFSDKIFNILLNNHRLVQVRGIRRRDALSRWSNIGSMTSYGSRQPVGGIKGDIYGPYACHKGDTPDDLRAVMRHALASSSAPLL